MMKKKIRYLVGLQVLFILALYAFQYTHDRLFDEWSLFFQLVTSLGWFWLIDSALVRPLAHLQQQAETLLHTSPSSKVQAASPFSYVQQALNEQATIIGEASGFVEKLRAGEEQVGTLEKSFTDHPLLTSLQQLKQHLHQLSQEEKQRNWATHGLAQLIEVLQSGSFTDPRLLGEQLLPPLVRYIEANQGGLFVMQEEEGEAYMELVACYAYGRQKHLYNRLEVGEGLVGQAYLEKETILLTEVPPDYLRITSGLGEANPRCIVIVPLLVNGQPLGVLEMASFQVFQPHQILFLEKLGENIASTLASARINQQTMQLLRDSQEQTQQMLSQEEEMRQNLEELSATQEHQARLQVELQNNELVLHGKLKELEEAKASLETRESEMKVLNEKYIKRSNQFKQQMETLDADMEHKNARLNVLLRENEELKQQLEKFNNQN
jgi:methyl-accepting chemotaxis protein